MYFEKLKYMEEVNSTASDLHDCVEEKMKSILGTEFKLNKEQSDKIWNTLQEVLEDFSETGDYKNYN